MQQQLQQQGREVDAGRAEIAEVRQQLQRKSTELDDRRAELDAANAQFEQQRHAWQASCDEYDARLGSQLDQFTQQQRDMAAQRERLQSERQQWEAQRAELQLQLEPQSRELDRRRAECEAADEALQQRRREWEAEQSEAQEQARRRQSRLDAVAAELEAAREALEARQRQPQAGGASEQSAQPQPAMEASAAGVAEPESHKKDTPVALSEILRRMGMEQIVDDETPSTNPAAPAMPDAEPALWQPEGASGSHSGTAHPPSDEEDESIEQYMARLLQRVGGSSSTSSRTRAAQDSARQRPAPVEPAPADAETSSQPAAPHARSEPIAPRAVAPERSVDLSAMRALANLSAQTAIDRHARQKRVAVTWAKLLVTSVATLVSAALLGIWFWDGCHEPVILCGAAASLLVALLWGVQYALVTGHVLIYRAGHSLAAAERGPETEGEEPALESVMPAGSAKSAPSSAAEQALRALARDG